MLTFTPRVVNCSTALAPSVVPGTLIMVLGRLIRLKRARALATEPAGSWASPGSSSNETNPSLPAVSS